MQIICTLNNGGPTRYNRLKARLDGISNTVLAKSLKELEEAGLVLRKEYLEIPVRVEYETTEACDRLIPVLDSLGQWYEEYAAESQAARASGCGQARDAGCGEHRGACSGKER